MNNEPVAWIDPYDLERLPHYDCHIGSQQLKNGIPLYTHPVKELTDAITLLEKYADKLEDERPNKGLSDVVLECVEILRKAQEK